MSLIQVVMVHGGTKAGMIKKLNGFVKIESVLLGLLLSIVAAGTANAFDFNGYTFNETRAPLNNTNVSVEVYSFGAGGPPALIAAHYNLSNASGYFNVTNITVNGGGPPYFYKIILRHFNQTTSTLDYIGQSLPEFPYGMILGLGQVDFYLKPGATINITAVNLTGARTSFRYMLKDTRLGYPVAENFNSEVSGALVYVPAERNYSIEIYPNMSFPVSYDLNNLTTYPNYYANITFNTSNTLKRVTGYANLSDGSANFSDLKIIAYLMEPGNMVFQDYPLPYNMSAWNCPTGPGSCESDIYNSTTGEYNITLPGAMMNANILLFATAYNSTTGTYYGAFRNISLGYSTAPVTSFNCTLNQLLGSQTNITINNAGGSGGPPGSTNVTTKKLSFQLKNGSANTNITGFAHVEAEVNYSAYNSSSFKWMVDVSQSNNGSFSIPALNANIRKINVFTQDYAPLKTSKTASQLSSEPVMINLAQFRPGDPDGGAAFTDTYMEMLVSRPECDVPYPASSCSLMPDAADGQSFNVFNPFKIVIGGGKISLRIKKPSQRITVHYKNVDMLASGPPDALFDDSATSSQSGSAVDQAWKFGSKGPEIYDEVLIGVPISSGMSISGVKIGKLYDENWGTTWDISTNSTAQIPSDYSSFNLTYFGSSGMACSTTDSSSSCYINATEGTLWLRIPHFSGVGPTISGTTTLSSSSGSGSGSGGSGVITSEPFDNIVKAERYENNLIANTSVAYSFSAAEHGVLQVVITGKENEDGITVRVESLKGTSKAALYSAPGIVYKNLNIIAGTKKIKEAFVKFRVESSWLGSNNLAASDLKLMKWDGSRWMALETTESNRDAAYTYYEAKTNSLSSFAVTGVKAAEAPTPSVIETAVPAKPDETLTATPAPARTEKASGFEVIIALITLCAVYMMRQKRR